MKKLYSYLLLIALGITTACANDKEDSLQSFWSDFRKAVIEENYQILKEHTQFPLVVKGVADFIPVQNIDDKKFDNIFKQIISQKMASFKDGELIEYTMKDLVVKTTKVDKKKIKIDNTYRIGEMVFEYKNNKWMFCRAYLTEQ